RSSDGSIQSESQQGILMRSFYWLFICAVTITLTGCGLSTVEVQPKLPTSSDSTSDLIVLLAEKDSPARRSVNPRKLAAIEILGNRGDEALPTLFQVALDTNSNELLRFSAMDAIGKFKLVPKDQIPELFEIRRSKNGIAVNDVFERSCKAVSKE